MGEFISQRDKSGHEGKQKRNFREETDVQTTYSVLQAIHRCPYQEDIEDWEQEAP